MQTISFTPDQERNGKHIAAFTTGDTTVLQMQFAPQQKPITLTIEARIGVTMPWAVVKTFASFPVNPPLIRLDIPSGVDIRLVTDAEQILTAGVLID